MNCTYCTDFKENPNRYSGNTMGSRDDNTVTYWLNGNSIVVCGCFKGSLDKFEHEINEAYDKEDKHNKDYMKYIHIVKTIMDMEK
jgi:hypothetical protein